MALGASKPSRKEEFLCHRALSQRLRRNLYFGGKVTEDAGSLPLMHAASRVFSGRPGRLRTLNVRDVTWITHQACISPAAVVMAMVYLERLAALRPDFLSSTHPKHLFVTSTLTASKFLYDDGEQEQVFNDEWAASADMEVSELNAAEIDFLSAMGWELYVSEPEFADMLSRVEAGAALAESSRRGWLTYSDLLSIGLTSNLDFTMALLKDALFKVVAVCSVAYLASVLTLMSSVLLVFHAPPAAPAPAAAPAQPSVFVARAPPPPPPSGPSLAEVADQLRAAAASSGLLLLAALTPLAAPQSAREEDGGEEEEGDVEEGEDEDLTELDRWLQEAGNETRHGTPPDGAARHRAATLSPPDPPPRLPASVTDSVILPADLSLSLPAAVTDLRWLRRTNDTDPAAVSCERSARQRWPRLVLPLAVCS